MAEGPGKVDASRSKCIAWVGERRRLKSPDHQFEMSPRTNDSRLFECDGSGEEDAARKRRGSKIDPYRAHVNAVLAEGNWNAEVIFCRIQADDYDGGRTLLRLGTDLGRVLRPAGGAGGKRRRRARSCSTTGASAGWRSAACAARSIWR